MDHDFLASLRQNHPAWRLLAADSAPFVVGFLWRAFVQPNARAVSEEALTLGLEDYLHHLRERLGEDVFPRRARDYLAEWADDARGYLRRYYPPDSDEPHYDLTPAAERAMQWLVGLEQRTFVGAESKLKLVFDLLRQIAQGTQTDPNLRIAELERRRAELDAEIEQIRAGRLALMDPTQLREWFLQAADTARALLADFRQVEENFRALDRQVRERVTTSEGSKGDVLEEVFGERDAIGNSDQGRSFRAFWDFLMSPARQEELGTLLEGVMALDPVRALGPDARLKRIHYDWLAAGEATQRTVARLSEQLRRYLDDQAWLENRRIMSILRDVEQLALAVREDPPQGAFTTVDALAPNVELPLERPLYSPPVKPVISDQPLEQDGADVSAEALFQQFYVDKDRLRARLRKALQSRRQISLVELLEEAPLEQGLAELVSWLTLATSDRQGVIDEERQQTITWREADGSLKTATLPTVVFVAAGTSRAAGI